MADTRFQHGDRVRTSGHASPEHLGFVGTVDQPEGAEVRNGYTWVVFDVTPDVDSFQDGGWYRTDELELVSDGEAA